jgi:hypothetical protein
MKDDSLAIILEEAFAFINRRRTWRTAGDFPVFHAAEHAFHPNPLRNHNRLRVNKPEIIKPVLAEQFLQLPSFDHLLKPRNREHTIMLSLLK